MINRLRLAIIISTLITVAPASFFIDGATVFAAQKQSAEYVCPMHAEVKSSAPGNCPKCEMALRKVDDAQAALRKEEPVEKEQSQSAPMRIPDVTVLDQDGRKLRFYTDLVKGRTVAINFIFTTCTTICPPLTATFRKVQQEMGDRVGRDVALISVSVDPATDVPERLKSFSAKFNAQPGWSFITGSKADIDQLLVSLGAFAADKNDHTPMILVGNDKAQHWTRTYGLATPATLTKVITEAAGKEAAVETRGEAEKKTKTPAESAAAYFPNHVLLTQESKEVRFFDDLLKGKTVLINFAFTTCAGVCPPMTANLAKVQQFLGDRVGRDITMITLSVDPAIDTPESLKKYAEKFKVKPGWYFLTGKKENVDLVLRKVGGYTEDKLQHSSVLIIGNVETGEWTKTHAMAKASEIADAVLKMAGPEKK
ncbi:MAG TPA: SCO family protein [Blastocatellia bacterium]|nr:SCO family protein [Blastocatellia bacterium]